MKANTLQTKNPDTGTTPINPATVPTHTDLIDLGQSIHDHGFGANERRISELVAAARQVAPELVSLDVLADRAHHDVVRARALSILTADWNGIEAAMQQEWHKFDASVAELLDIWTNHQQLRTHDAAIGQLAESRSKLDEARVDVTRRRRRLFTRAA